MTSTLLFISMPGMGEMLIVLFLALLMFGGAKLPGLMRNLGRSANEFKRGLADTGNEEEEDAVVPAEKTKV